MMAVHAHSDERSALLLAPSHAYQPARTRRARSFSDPELREVLVNPPAPGHTATHAPHLAPRPSSCTVHIVDYGRTGVVEHAPRHTYAGAPPRAGTVRWVCVEDAPSCELALLSRALGLDALHALGQARTSAPRMDVQDERRVVAVVEAPSCTAIRSPRSATAFTRVVLAADLGAGLVVSVHGGDVRGTTELRARVSRVLRADAREARTRAAVHVLCSAATLLIERYYAPLSTAGDMLDDVESELLQDAAHWDAGTSPDLTGDVVRDIAGAKRTMLAMRRRLWPLRRGLSRLALVPLHTSDADSRLAVRTLLDHVVHVLDILDVQRDTAHSLLDIHLGAQNNRIQLIMKRISVVTTIFVPLTFLTGLEGTNFRNMPELDGKYSYLTFLCVICATVVFMVSWFRKRGWL